jgi:hypothetical protein
MGDPRAEKLAALALLNNENKEITEEIIRIHRESSKQIGDLEQRIRTGSTFKDPKDSIDESNRALITRINADYGSVLKELYEKQGKILEEIRKIVGEINKLPATGGARKKRASKPKAPKRKSSKKAQKGGAKRKSSKKAKKSSSKAKKTKKATK